jgi:hypothetical protein
MKPLLYGSLAFFLLLAGCATKSKYETYQSRLMELGGNKLVNNYSSVVLIPQEGCGGCISNATQYLTEHIDSLRQVAIIFTGVRDKKLLKLRIDNRFFSRDNVYFDDNNLFMHLDVASTYPQLLHIKDGQVALVETYSPEKKIIAISKATVN